MRLALPALLFLASCAKEAPPPADVASNKHLIWEAVKGYHAAGDKGDVSGMKALLHSEVMMYKGAEDFVRGIGPVEEELEARAERIKGEGRKTLVGGEQIQVMGDVAVVTYIASVATHRGAVSMVFRRSQAKWLITHIHDTWLPPPAPDKPK